MTNGVLTIDQLIKLQRTATPRKVDTPEISPGSCVYVADLNADDRDLLEMQWANYADGDRVGFRKYVVAWCLCDEKNQRLIMSGRDETLLEDAFIQAMNHIGSTMPLTALTRIFNAATEVIGLTAVDIEDMEKN